MEMKKVIIDRPFITLGQLLKEEAIIPTGGAAKWYLKENTVLVNGDADDRRGRKLYPGDEVTLPDSGKLVIESK
ncbi:S4 domain-containing protein YaaA [Limosilactobacillus viscerum]|uniref:S4 domain-containing protein YaaA n=1 Tax=Limosilactobacillus viscerum TaxID=2993450 RepID=UPI0024BB8626|nr:S4 domain-containing protein YaaA [Limosilactobacillus viscerum]